MAADEEELSINDQAISASEDEVRKISVLLSLDEDVRSIALQEAVVCLLLWTFIYLAYTFSNCSCHSVIIHFNPEQYKLTS